MRIIAPLTNAHKSLAQTIMMKDGELEIPMRFKNSYVYSHFHAWLQSTYHSVDATIAFIDTQTVVFIGSFLLHHQNSHIQATFENSSLGLHLAFV